MTFMNMVQWASNNMILLVFVLFIHHHIYPAVAIVRDIVSARRKGVSWKMSWNISRNPRNIYRDRLYGYPAMAMLCILALSFVVFVAGSVLKAIQ